VAIQRKGVCVIVREYAQLQMCCAGGIQKVLLSLQVLRGWVLKTTFDNYLSVYC